MKKIAIKRKIKTYNEFYNREKTFVENLHDFLKLNKLVEGEHYLEIDCGDYIAFCPFIYEIFGSFRGFFQHCVTMQRRYFDNYFDTQFYKYHNLKVFFLKKDSFFKRSDKYHEFTCWLKSQSCYDSRITKHEDKVFYNFHDCDNRCGSPYLEYEAPIIEKNYEKIMNVFINSEVYSKLIGKKCR